MQRFAKKKFTVCEYCIYLRSVIYQTGKYILPVYIFVISQMQIHKSYESLHSKVPKRLLPDELGGDAGPLKKMIGRSYSLLIILL